MKMFRETLNVNLISDDNISKIINKDRKNSSRYWPTNLKKLRKL